MPIINLSQNSHVILFSTMDIHDSLIAQTCAPNGKGSAGVVLFVGPFHDIVDVAGELVVHVDGHFTSGEENSVYFGEDVVQLLMGVVIIEWDDLGS